MHGHKPWDNELEIAEGSIIKEDFFSHRNTENEHEQGGGDQCRKDRLVRDREKTVDLSLRES